MVQQIWLRGLRRKSERLLRHCQDQPLRMIFFFYPFFFSFNQDRVKTIFKSYACLFYFGHHIIFYWF